MKKKQVAMFTLLAGSLCLGTGHLRNCNTQQVPCRECFC